MTTLLAPSAAYAAPAGSENLSRGQLLDIAADFEANLEQAAAAEDETAEESLERFQGLSTDERVLFAEDLTRTFTFDEDPQSDGRKQVTSSCEEGDSSAPAVALRAASGEQRTKVGCIHTTTILGIRVAKIQLYGEIVSKDWGRTLVRTSRVEFRVLENMDPVSTIVSERPRHWKSGNTGRFEAFVNVHRKVGNVGTTKSGIMYHTVNSYGKSTRCGWEGK
ncbi:hypothetical protein [Zhihengliuella halotolerans]|uniref:hypothetical protein n=1 Tax=Zhihengliuella halotolerans TaxID=370736 RepID=UPI0011AFAA65|nr:hypothetical protein [Zhihengliuella halotolerans]